MTTFPRRIITLYWKGFRAMTIGRILWRIVLLKLIAFFIILKLFFPDYLHTHFTSDEERAAHVLDNLTMKQTAMQRTDN